MHVQQPKHHQYGQTFTEDTGPENQVFQDISEGMVRRATAETTGVATDHTATGSIKLDQIKGDTYKLAMHNFLATSIDLF